MTAPGRSPRQSRRQTSLRDLARPGVDKSPTDARVPEHPTLRRHASFACAVRYYEKSRSVNEPAQAGSWMFLIVGLQTAFHAGIERPDHFAHERFAALAYSPEMKHMEEELRRGIRDRCLQALRDWHELLQIRGDGRRVCATPCLRLSSDVNSYPSVMT